jgi:hypothetical protein
MQGLNKVKLLCACAQERIFSAHPTKRSITCRKLSMSGIPIISRHWIQRYYLVYQLSLKFVAGQLPQNILFYLQKVLESVWNGHQTC